MTEVVEDSFFFYVLNERLDIVYADDDPILREFAQVNLASDTTTIRVAENGREALRLVEAHKPDLILLDLEMPEMDGFAVLAALARHEGLSRIPVIVVTGREDVAAIDRAYEAGATSFVVKPLNWRQLSYQIRYVHRSASNEAHLLEKLADARLRMHDANARLKAIAQEGSRYLATSVAAHPQLRPEAHDFAERLAEALGSAAAEQHAHKVAA